MLTARDEDVDKIIGLEVGADDYLTKPFNPRELVARVKSVLRRSTPDRKELESAVIRHGDLVVDAGRREVRVDDEEIQLAPKEFDLLWELLDHRGLVLTRDQLLERVWGYTFAGDTRTVDVHVRQLRRKLGDASPIVTVWGVGYKVSPAREPAPSSVDAGARACSALCASSSGALPRRGRSSSGSSRRRSRSSSSSRTRRAARARTCGARRAGSRSLYTEQASGSNDPRSFAPQLEDATGDRIYYVPPRRLRPLPGRGRSCALPKSAIDFASVAARQDAAVRVQAARLGQDVARGRASRSNLGKKGGSRVLRRARRGEAEGPARDAGRAAARAARARPCSAGSSFASLARVSLAPADAAGARALARGRRGRARQLRSRRPGVPGGDEVGHLAERFREMARRLSEAEQLERTS